MDSFRVRNVDPHATWGFPKIRGTFLGPNKDYSMLGSILGSPYFGKLPHCALGPPKKVQFCRRVIRVQHIR